MQPIDRDRLRATLQAAAQGLSTMADRAIALKIPQLLPASLRPLLPLMVGRLQTQSLISDAATRVTDELSDDEWRSLFNLVKAELEMIAPGEREDDVIRAMRAGTLEAARRESTSAAAHLRAILSE